MDSWEDGETVENETSGRDLSEHLALYNAALRGDWETANSFFQQNIEKTETITDWDRRTALHVAVQSGRANNFVRKLVALMSPQALALRDFDGNTALHYAAMVGNKEAAAIMVEKYPDLLYIKNERGYLAVLLAAAYCKKETLEYLISVCKPNVENTPFEGQLGLNLLNEIIICEFLDIALDLVEGYPDLARLNTKVSNRCALSFMAERESVFPSRESFNWWEKFIYKRVPLEERESKSKYGAGDIEARNFSTSYINGGNYLNSSVYILGNIDFLIV